MISKNLRSQFSVFMLFAEADTNKALKGAMIEAGYESFAFIDQDLLVSRVKEAAPHVIIFALDALQDSLSEFVQKVLDMNQEILFICVAPSEQTTTLKDYQEYNFVSLVPHGEFLAERVVWNLDEICTSLLRLYQNENLLEAKKALQNEVHSLNGKVQELEAIKHSPPVEVSFQEKIKLYDDIESKDEAIHALFRELPCRAIFFKFLPTVNSFVATMAKGLDIESVKGVGSRLKSDEIEKLQKILQSGGLPAALEDLMINGLKVKSYIAKAVSVYRGIDGLMIFWGESLDKQIAIDNLFSVFLLKYQQVHLIKRSENFDIFDSLTELYNKGFYFKKLEEEVSRAKRIQKATSVVRLRIDAFAEMEAKVGKANRDLILRTIGAIIKKTSRINDIVARLEEDQFGLILVHCARKGAALRAERLRRIIEGHSFGINDLKVTVSSGVSEYPSLAAAGAELDSSAEKALDFIISRGGNKVCLYKPPDNFKPDFEVASI